MDKTIQNLIKTHGDSNLGSFYLEAKRTYYQGEGLISDMEFDVLEEYLESQDRLTKLVGFNDDDRNAKFNHQSRMLSLGKFQASSDGTPPTEQAEAWLNSKNQETYEGTPKFDGNAINLIYRNGRLDCGLSRGSGVAGRDYTDKLIGIVPLTIETEFEVVEVRGEIVIPTKIFDEKYSHDKKNERNFVAGILNRPTTPALIKIINDFVFMAVEGRGFHGNVMDYIKVETLKDWNFYPEYQLFTYLFSKTEFLNAYKTMLHHRKEVSPFRLDGFVIKTLEDSRADFGENKHDPNWAIAIKFPPEEAITTIIDVKWQFGKTGQLTPVAILVPTPLDGTTVRRATVHNYGWMAKKGCFPGAVVSIAKKGDIIPQIIEIKQPSETVYSAPTNCPKCNSELEIINKLHLQCVNEECGGVDYLKFAHGFNRLGIVGSGGSINKRLYAAGFKNILDVLDRKKFTKEVLVKTGQFKSGKTLNKMFEQVEAFNTMPLSKLILILSFDGMGNTIAREVSNQIAGITHSFKSLEKVVCAGFENGSEKHTLIFESIERLKSNGISVEFPVEIVDDGSETYEMTGSPKPFGFKAKKDFIVMASEKGFKHSKLTAESKYLITDSLTASSSKMKKATKLGVEIITYADFIKL